MIRSYLLGLLTLPALALIGAAGAVLLSRSSCTRVWCDCGWEAHPSASPLPWWLTDNLHYRVHTLSRRHRSQVAS